jgi:hypothetical protein
MSINDIKISTFEWSSDDTTMSVTAETIDSLNPNIVTIDLSNTSMNSGISTSLGYNGSWASGSTITLSDPYEEMEKRLATLEKIIAEEKRIRDECPAVRNAYDEYRFLLVLAQRNKGDLLTDNS